MNIQIELGSKVKIGLTLVALVAMGGLTYWGVKKIDEHNKFMKAKKEAEEAELKKKKDILNDILTNLMYQYDSNDISKLTLQNEKLNPESRSYMYTKFSSLRNKIHKCTLLDYESGYFEDLKNKLIEMANALENEDEKALSARSDAMKNEDEHLEKIHAENMAKLEQERKMKHELDILREKNQGELDMYKAKAATEKAKMESLSKALRSADNKAVNTSFNIKTNISED